MPKALPLRLGVNVDHVATLRNARGGTRPDPVRAALAAIEAGADGITAHLREDRRHIRDEDMTRLKAEISKPLNFEMAATADMLRLSLAKNSPKKYAALIKKAGPAAVPARDAAAIPPDGSADHLTGGLATDWFIADPTDVLSDRAPQEQLNV